MITKTRQERATHPDRGVRERCIVRLRPTPSLPTLLRLPLPLRPSHKPTPSISRLAVLNTDTCPVCHLVSTALSYLPSGRPEGPRIDHSTVSHQRGASYDPYSTDPFAPSNSPPIPVPPHSPPIQQQSNPYTDPYPSGGDQYLTNPHNPYPQHDHYQNPYTQGAGQGTQRAYTLGGSGYGDNVVPDNQAGPAYTPNPYTDSYGNQPPVRSTSPTQMYTDAYQPTPVQTWSPTQAPQRPPGAGGAGPLPRQQTLVNMTPDDGGYQPGPVEGGGQYDDRPPTYDEHDPRPAGVWSTKS